jgi:3-oxoacyl-[acyl-carrier protein] reductase
MMENKIALVTGGSGAIGRAIALELAKKEYNIVLTEHKAPCKMVAKEIEEIGRRTLVIDADVANLNDTKEVIIQIKKKFGRLDLIVNNAGLNPPTPVEEIEEDEWDLVMSVNLKSTFFYSVRGVELMKTRGGSIVNISSQNAKDGGTLSGAHYAATKAGINVLTVRLAREFAPYRVRVNAIAAGAIASTMTKQFPPEIYTEFLKKIPLEREGKPEDVAAAVGFLVSDSASWITGEILDVNGGMYMD